MERLYASAGNLEKIQALIAKFYGGSTITLAPISEREWSVSNRNGKIDGVAVRLHKGRYRFVAFG